MRTHTYKIRTFRRLSITDLSYGGIAESNRLKAMLYQSLRKFEALNGQIETNEGLYSNLPF